jgi:dTDP-glucose 4,6-dehydratase
MKTMLVTGGAGFIGSNFIKYILDKYKDYIVINYDALTYAGDLNNLKEIEQNPNYVFVKGDISDKNAVKSVFENFQIDYVVNFAAESHVDRSIEDPDIFIRSNVLGTQTLLDVAKSFWKNNPQDKYDNAFIEGVKFLQISTDEVYGALGSTGMFTETTNLAPNSPYSASKASADLMVRAYFKTFGMPINITRCSNNYGPNQYPEKLIPLMIEKCLKGEKLPVYGDGLQIRDWLYVLDHCSAIDTVLHNGKCGEIYNVGGNNEKANLDIVRLILDAFNKGEDMIEHVKDRPGHDRRYAIDNTKITTELGWQPQYTFEEGMKKTIEYYRDYFKKD